MYVNVVQWCERSEFESFEWFRNKKSNVKLKISFLPCVFHHHLFLAITNVCWGTVSYRRERTCTNHISSSMQTIPFAKERLGSPQSITIRARQPINMLRHMGEKQSDGSGRRLADKDVLCHGPMCLSFSKDIPVTQEFFLGGWKCLSFSCHQILFLNHDTVFVQYILQHW